VNALLHHGSCDKESEKSKPGQNSDGESWEGIPDNSKLNQEEEYIDDERFTTVTVEAVDISRDGLKATEDEDDEDQGATTEGRGEFTSGRGEEPLGGKANRTWTKERRTGPKKRIRNFRYESKAERKATRYKERLGNKTKAIARKQ